jgi:hypothetical protein
MLNFQQRCPENIALELAGLVAPPGLGFGSGIIGRGGHPMRAAWHEKQGPARDVLVVGEMPDPVPGAGEVRIRIAASSVNPGDRRSGRMPSDTAWLTRE